MTQTVANIEKYLDGVVGKALRLNKQALALTIPYIIQDLYPHLTLTYLEDKTPVLCDNKSFWKVCCGRKTFDIAPSYTKGHGRCKDGISPIEALLDKGFDGVVFVDFNNVDNIIIKWKLVDQLPDTVNGAYKKGELFE